jgi:hypothetical protein
MQFEDDFNDYEDSPFAHLKDELRGTELNSTPVEYPFNLEEFGKLVLYEKVCTAYLYNNPVGTYLFTIEEN